tara:strand:- start:1791 stop:2819 length:1029 start_codon:yes stop_codon:yes gene_type:complete
MFKDKEVLVTGGTGLVGRELVELLFKEGAKVTSVSMDENNFRPEWNVTHLKLDLRDFKNCVDVCKNKQYIFHIAGIKGSPVLTHSKQYTFFTNFLQLNTNMIAAMYDSEMENGVYTSTVGTYGPSEVFFEDKLWDQNPSENDWFAGWAKRMGEVQVDAYLKQYKEQRISVIKPVNIYGKYDNFDLRTSTLVPSLTRKVAEAKEEVEVWGDGSAERDIIHARDVARAAIHVVENKLYSSYNVGRGTGVSIKTLIETLIKVSGKNLAIKYDPTKPKGDSTRTANIDKITGTGFKPLVSLEEGLAETLDWYRTGHTLFSKDTGALIGRYDPFLTPDYSNKINELS